MRRTLILSALLVLLNVGCALLNGNEPTPIPEPTPVGDTLTYLVPIYTATLNPADYVPGTQLHYIRKHDGGYDVTIDGLPATKQIADSFNWQGVMAPGVVGRFNLRISPSFGDTLIVAGPLNISILNPVPVPLLSNTPVAGTLHYGGIVTRFVVPVGTTVPGTTLVYQGETDQGIQIDGTGGYPYFADADSVSWLGHLRDNVIIRYQLRIEGADANNLRLDGTAELWIQ
jgi:hypothetical protein